MSLVEGLRHRNSKCMKLISSYFLTNWVLLRVFFWVSEGYHPPSVTNSKRGSAHRTLSTPQIQLVTKFFCVYLPNISNLSSSCHTAHYIIALSGDLTRLCLHHRWQTQGPRAESGPPPCFIWPGTLFLPGGSAELLAPT